MQIVKTEAFVLKSFKYGETSKIVTLFTRDYGKLKAIVKGVRNYKSKFCGTMESMNYISAVIYLKDNLELQLISNAEYKKSFPGIITDYDKIQVAFRLIEILNKALADYYINQKLFGMLIHTFEQLENAQENYNNFVLHFLIILSRELGICPEFNVEFEENETFFRINEFYTDKSNYKYLMSVSNSTSENLESLIISDKILRMYISNFERLIAIQTQGFQNYKSSKVFTDLNLIVI